MIMAMSSSQIVAKQEQTRFLNLSKKQATQELSPFDQMHLKRLTAKFGSPNQTAAPISEERKDEMKEISVEAKPQKVGV